MYWLARFWSLFPVDFFFHYPIITDQTSSYFGTQMQLTLLPFPNDQPQSPIDLFNSLNDLPFCLNWCKCPTDLLVHFQPRQGRGWTGHRGFFIVETKQQKAVEAPETQFDSQTWMFFWHRLCVILWTGCACLWKLVCSPSSFPASAVWHLENIGKTGHAPMPDKQNTKYASFIHHRLG